MSDRWLDTKEAAAYVGLNPNTLEKKRVYGGGPEFAKVGGGRSVRYRLSTLEAWMNSVTVSSTSELGAG